MYGLDSQSANYDKNASHRIKEHTLVTEIVDTCGSAVDSTFASIEVACQPNYAIGVFKDNRLMLTPLKKFHQVRPSFEHVDEERQRSTIHTREQLKAE